MSSPQAPTPNNYLVRNSGGAIAPFPRARFLKFCEQLKIQSKEYGLTKFRLLGSQTYILDEIEKGMAEGQSTFVILKARQLGSSAFFIALDLFWNFEHQGLSGAFVTHTDVSRDQFRQTIDVYLAHLPKTHKIRAPKHNRNMIIFANGSQMVYLVAGVREKGKAGLGRSGAYNFAHCTEVAFWGNEEELKEFRAAQASHYPHRMQIYETTANGFNFFEEMWQTAKASRTQRAIFVGWWRNELYAFPENNPNFGLFMPEGNKSQLTVLERKRKAAVKQQYGIDVTHEQIAWYRWKMDDECDGDQAKMDEMFPWTEDDAFVATGSKFFTNESLTDAMKEARTAPLLAYAYSLGRTWQETAVHQVKVNRAQLKIWEEANPHGVYVIGCDPAYGSSDEADRTVIAVYRCFADKCVQAAEFVSPMVSTYQCAWVLCHLAGYYRDVMVNLEITGPGQAVFGEMNALRQFAAGYQNQEGSPDLKDCLGAMRHFLYRRTDALRGDLAYQWRTTAESKIALLNGFKDSFELRRCIIKSMPCLEEMKSVVYEDGSIQAEGRSKDDRVMAGGLAHEAWKKWVAPKLVGQGMTYERVYASQNQAGPNPLQRRVLNYMNRLG